MSFRVAPQPGDSLIFSAGSARLTNVNTFAAGTSFRTLLIIGSGYLIGGNPIAVSNGVVANIAAGGADVLAFSIGGGSVR